MKALGCAAGIAACLVIVAPGTAPAETNSVPDGDAHPYVGQFVADTKPEHPGLEGGCTGALISPTVFVTAAHCVYGRPRILTGPTYVMFDGKWEYPGTPSDLHLVRTIAWDPAFEGPGFIGSHDRAVMVLAAPVAGIAPAQLPSAGLLDRLAGAGGAVGSWYDSVGYGLEGLTVGPGPREPIGDPDTRGYQERRAASSLFMALTPDLLKLNTESALGSGGNCGADSGSPHMLAGTDVVVATSSVIDGACEALSANPRTDTAEARAFVGRFVDLP